MASFGIFPPLQFAFEGACIFQPGEIQGGYELKFVSKPLGGVGVAALKFGEATFEPRRM